MSDQNASTRRAQARSLPTAVAWGEDWTAGDIELVAGNAEETAEELARALGRTVYAIQSVREALRKGEIDARGRKIPAKQPEFFFHFDYRR